VDATEAAVAHDDHDVTRFCDLGNTMRYSLSEASSKLDISRSTMYRLLEIYHIQIENGKAVLSEGAAG